MLNNGIREDVSVQYSESETSTVDLPGWYHAAAYAAARVNLPDRATSMTNKSLSMGGSFPTPDISRSDKNSLTALGVTVTESDTDTVRREVSTDMNTSIPAQEPCVTEANDQVARDVRTILENTYKGKKITTTLMSDYGITLYKQLDREVSDGIINGYDKVSYSQSTSDPRQINTKFRVKNIYPLLWGDIEITITV